MKSKIVSGSALAAAAVSLALSGAVATPAQARSAGHQCMMGKGSCGAKMKCMTKAGVCKHHMHGHKGGCHHMKSHCKTK
jgi:hypothetical protein